ncbi:MAG: TetR family transcriptional regulator [Sphingomonadales bacterium]|nr:TetR family transcriptional regulator [Sphingomonadales bacterium]MDE2569780.1 TetR family transcriptional regulator [Sphingomonadales bacterium]
MSPASLSRNSKEAIIEQALQLVASEGIDGLTLRPLAQRTGLSVASVTHHLGSKGDMIDSLAMAALKAEVAFYADNRQRFEGFGPLPAGARARLAEQVFGEWLDRNRLQLTFLIELVHSRVRKPDDCEILEDWFSAAGDFWSEIVFGSPQARTLAMGYILDEAAYSLGVGENLFYRALRSLCLDRLAHGIFPAQAGTRDEGEAFAAVVAALKPPASNGSTRLAEENSKRERIAACAAEILSQHGIEGITHRSVGKAANVPPSTVVYHFGSREALISAGLHAIIADFHALAHRDTATPQDVQNERARRLILATTLIANSSARFPALRPDALDMRRRRGENIVLDGVRQMGFADVERLDRLSAQTLAVAYFGLRIMAMALHRPEQQFLASAVAAFRRR